MCACVKPCKTALHRTNHQAFLCQELLVDGCDFKFSTLAFQRMRSSLSNYYKYLSRPKRNAPVVSFNELIDNEDGLGWEDVISRQDELLRRLETEMCLHALAAKLPHREMRIIRMKVRGDRMHDIAKQERMTFRQINQALENCYPAVISVLWG